MSITAEEQLWSDFPHGTIEGYRRGCTGKICRGTEDVGISCSAIYTRYMSDWSFKKRLDSGMQYAEIASLEAEEKKKQKKSTVVVKKREKSVTRKYATKTPANYVPGPMEIQGVRKGRGRIPSPAMHGTFGGYRRGCRENCPAEISCHTAYNQYQRERYYAGQERKKAKLA